ncbi:MAG: histidine kinase [Oscillospiraceae bacterium]|jgi:sensor histidine kinase YesM|nr:histidine kinase [Oscillospiraceae bacterium]
MKKTGKMNRLNVFIVLSTFIITALSTLMTGALFYIKSADALTAVYGNELIRELERVNGDFSDRIAIVDSLFPLIMSSTVIRDNLDPAADYNLKEPQERRLEIERQMSYMLVNSFLWGERMLKGVYIFDSDGNVSAFSVSGAAAEYAGEIASRSGAFASNLQMKTRGDSDCSVWFVKNIFSMHTGKRIAVIVIEADKPELARICSDGADENWIILLFSDDILLSFGADFYGDGEISAVMSAAKTREGFQEITAGGTEFFMASRGVGDAGTAIVAAPKEYLMRNSDESRASFLSGYAVIAVIAMLVTVFISLFITRPIKQMTDYVRDVTIRRTGAERPKVPFRELDEFTEAFAEMLKQLETYYNDLREQQILLKNAEIKALQAQMTPHFLFNVLNTIAWTAEIEGKSEIYRMVLSLSELLRSNILSKDKDYVTLKEELDYARFYIYLQQRRFEGKFKAEIDAAGVPEDTPVPRFCIQPLVENAVSHGFEPLPDDGREWRLNISVSPENGGIRVRVEDNGVGFPDGFDLESPAPPDGTHTGVGLKNLNRRLALLTGNDAGLSIVAGGKTTAVTFRLPGKKGV